MRKTPLPLAWRKRFKTSRLWQADWGARAQEQPNRCRQSQSKYCELGPEGVTREDIPRSIERGPVEAGRLTIGEIVEQKHSALN